MISLSGIPFLRFSIAFISGILFYIFSDPSFHFLTVTLGSFGIYLVLFSIQKLRRSSYYFLRPIVGFTALSTLFLSGILTCQLSDEKNQAMHLLNNKEGIKTYTALITSIPEEKNKTYKLEAEIRAYSTTSHTYTANGKLIVYLPKNEYKPVTYGDVLIITGMPQLAKPPLNPYEFNYQRYLKFHHIYHTHLVKEGNYKIISTDQGNPIVAFAYLLRSKANEVIIKNIPGQIEQGIASALLLGLRSTIDEELKTVYSATGTTHVLAVSGMHVLILFQFLMLLLQFGSGNKLQKIFLPILSLTLLALYVMITGFSPSVLRAAIMFGMVIIGKAIGRNLNIYNTISFSAFCLLAYDPFMIMDTGFQLSYLALLGIVYFTDKIHDLIEVTNFFYNKLWEMTSVSLAAQITTLPLTVYYFNQIPLIFLVSNFVAILISNGLLYLGFTLLTFAFISPIATVLGLVMKYMIIFMNQFLILINKIPFATISGIHLSFVEVLLIYLSIILLSLFIATKRVGYMMTLFMSISLIITSITVKTIQQLNQKQVVVFNIQGHYAISFIKGNEAIIISDSLLSKEKMNRSILPMLSNQGVKHFEINQTTEWLPVHSTKNYYLFSFNNKIITVAANKISTPINLPDSDLSIIHPGNFDLVNTTAIKRLVLLPIGKNTIHDHQDNRIYDLKEKPAYILNL